jgi:hypothetical protein
MGILLDNKLHTPNLLKYSNANVSLCAMTYTPPEYNKTAFNCPICGAFAKQMWTQMRIINSSEQYNASVEDPKISVCNHCSGFSIWKNKKLICPNTGTAPLPNIDMPNDVAADYDEARNILNLSPRGAAALLRLAIQKLCIHLGGKGKDLNSDIGQLVKNGLPEKLQKALDSVRVIGNNAVHPGKIDLKDDIKTANQLFVFLNIICDNQISQHKLISQFYDNVIPESAKNAIEKRDT